ALGMGIGRFGCLLNGCCWGKESQMPWAISFPAGSIPWEHQLRVLGSIDEHAVRSLPVHPTQIYLALAGWLLLGLTLWFYPRRRHYGEVMALLMIGYAVTRFSIEFFRGDEPLWGDGLTVSQNISVVILAGGVFLWEWLRRRPAIS